MRGCARGGTKVGREESQKAMQKKKRGEVGEEKQNRRELAAEEKRSEERRRGEAKILRRIQFSLSSSLFNIYRCFFLSFFFGYLASYVLPL